MSLKISSIGMHQNRQTRTTFELKLRHTLNSQRKLPQTNPSNAEMAFGLRVIINCDVLDCASEILAHVAQKTIVNIIVEVAESDFLW